VPTDGSVRAVIDTNVLLSGLLWRGKPHMLIEQARAGALTLVSSPALLAELAEVTARPKFKYMLARSNTNPELMLAQVRLLVEIVDPPPLREPVSRDPDDDAVLALADAARPDLIVTGDKDLLVLGAHAGVPIVSATEAVARIAAG
jgi:putative PIN family toxin of toxin-antitoxin system